MANTPKNLRRPLDPADRKLLEALQRDAGQRLEELGALVDLAPSTVHDRLRQLEEAGVLQRWTIDIDARAVGLDVLAFVSVQATEPCSKLRLGLEGLPEIEECHSVAGGMSMLLKVRVPNTEGLLMFTERLRQIRGIESTDTTIVLQTQFDRPMAFPGITSDSGPGRSRTRTSPDP